MRTWLFPGLVVTVAAGPALAQPPACTSAGMPLHIRGRRAVLRLPASATAKITPNELVADLMAPANAPAAAAVAMAPGMPPPDATPDQQDITPEAGADVVMRTRAAARSPGP